MSNVPETAAPRLAEIREPVPTALILAAAELLGEVGPSRMSMRDIAERAGVNKGQIHHYFGGKQALVTEAMRLLATEHFARAMTKADEIGVHYEPFELERDRPYRRALTQLILDGDLATATLEFGEGISVSRVVMEKLAAARGLDEPDDELRADVAAAMALELGWSAFQPFILEAVGLTDGDAAIERLRAGIVALTEKMA